MGTFNYDATNRQIVEASDRLILATGGAGTGKTRAAIRRAEWIADNCKLGEGQRILFLSFSRASRARMRQALRLHATALLPHCEVVTFDSMCRSLATRYGEWLGLSGQLRISQRDSDEPSYHFEPPEDGQYATFPGIRSLALRVLSREDVVRTLSDAYPFIMVDEFQDTREEHYNLLMRLWPHSAISAFGDPYQDILPGANTFDAMGALRGRGAKPFELTHQQRQPEWLRLFAEAVKQDDPQIVAQPPVTKEYGNVEHVLRVCIHWDIHKARRAGQHVAVITFRTDRALQIAACLRQDKTTTKGTLHHRWPVTVDCSDAILGAHLATIELIWQALLDQHDATFCGLAQESLCEVVKGQTPEGRRKAVKARCPETTIADACRSAAQAITGCAANDFIIAADVVNQLHEQLGDKKTPECSLLSAAVRQLQGHIPDDGQAETPADARRVMQRARVSRLAARDLDGGGAGDVIRVMNVHQAKNREFDFVALIYDVRDIHGGADTGEAYERHRMLLYQAITRAKQNLIIYYWGGDRRTELPLGPCLSKMLQ
jgi:hypothetical protein